MIIFFISTISFILVLVHFVIYKTIVSIFSLSLFWRIISASALIVLCLSFVLASILTFNFDNLLTRILYTFSATWLGFAFYLFLASCVFALTSLIFSIFNIDISLQWFGIVCLLLAVIISIYGTIHARTIVVKDLTATLPNLPIEWQAKKAVFISDIHLGAVNGQSFAKEIVVKINEINPDIVFIGGDLYDGVKVDELNIIKPFGDLHPVLGTYFVTGNHEEFRDDKHYLKNIESIGIFVLDNRMVRINGLQLIGVGDRDSINPRKFQDILTNLKIDKNIPVILLKHQPSQLNIADKAGISLQISGHTHKAQTFPLNIFTHFIFKGYDYGFHMYDKMAVYTSSGVGTWGPPLRVGSDGEIVVLNFTKK